MITVEGPGYSTRRVVHLVSHYPPDVGGMEQVVQSLALTQHDLGMQVRVLTSRARPPAATDNPSPFPVTRLKALDIAHTPVMPGLLPQLCGLGPGAVVHLHVSSAYLPELTWLYGRLARAKYMAHVHLDVPPSGRAGFLLEPYKRLLLARVLRDAAGIIVPTDDYRYLISHKYDVPAERIVAIANGTHHSIAKSPKPPPKPGHVKRLLFVGRLTVQKNIPLMLQAVATYAKKYGEDIELSIVGDGEDSKIVTEQIRKLGLTRIVTTKGALVGEALETAYRESDLFLLTSARESFGMVFIEAMTKGVPIVTVSIPAVRNVVLDGVNGLLASPEPDGIAESIHRLLTDSELYRKISGNNLVSARRHDWRAAAFQVNRAYEAMIG